MSKSNAGWVKKLALGAVIAVVLGVAAPQQAHADDHRGGPPHGGYHGHDRNWHGHYRRPGYVYAPPTAVYAPPEPSPGINLILPLHFG